MVPVLAPSVGDCHAVQVLGWDACFAVEVAVAFPCEEEPVYILIEIADAQLASPAGQVGQSQGGFRICEEPGLVGYLVFVRDARFAFLVEGVHVPGIFVGGVGGKGEQVSVPVADASFRAAGRDVRLVPVLYRPVAFGQHCPDVVFRLPEEGVGFIRDAVPAVPFRFPVYAGICVVALFRLQCQVGIYCNPVAQQLLCQGQAHRPLVGGFHGKPFPEGIADACPVAGVMLGGFFRHLVRVGNPRQVLLPCLDVVQVVFGEQVACQPPVQPRPVAGKPEDVLCQYVVGRHEFLIQVIIPPVAAPVQEVVEIEMVFLLDAVVRIEAGDGEGAVVMPPLPCPAGYLVAGGADVRAVPAVFAVGGVDGHGFVPRVGKQDVHS